MIADGSFKFNHMRDAWRELMFADEDLAAKRTGDPVAPATLPDAAMKEVNSRILDDGSLVHSFQTLMAHLQTIVRNTFCMQKGVEDAPTFELVITPDDQQKQAFELISQIRM